MLDMFVDSITLFLKGRLFQDYAAVFRQAFIGIAVIVILSIGLAKLGVAVPIAIGVAAFIGGGLQPFLFKDLKYK